MQTYTPLEHRPGDTPTLYALDGGAVAVGADGKIARLTGLQKLVGLTPVPLEPGVDHILRAAWRRVTDSPDPASDAVAIGVIWLDADKAVLSQTVAHTDLAPRVTDGRRSVALLVGPGTETADAAVPAPAAARYAQPFVETFGADHATDIEICALERSTLALVAPSLAQGYREERILYVAQDGDNGRTGEGRDRALRDIEAARDLVAASDDPTAIQVYPGTYRTQGHIDFPDHCTGVIAATAARSTRIVPAPGFEERNVFRMGNGGYVQGFSFEGGWRVDSLDDPTEGFAISFRPGAVINRTVYAHNIVMYRTGDPVLIPPPLDRDNQNPMVGRGGGVILADRAVVSPYSVFPQIMAWGATPSNPNGIGYCARNGAFINAINAIAIWSHKQYMALDGGLIIASGCASQAGDWSLWSEGYRTRVEPYTAADTLIGSHPTAAAAIESDEAAITDAMWDHLVAQGYVDGLSTESAEAFEESARRDAAILLLSLRYDLGTGQQQSTRLFTQGMYDWNGAFVGSLGSLPWFTMAWRSIRDALAARLAAGPQAMVTALIDDVLIATTNADPAPSTRIPSVVSAQNHQWNQTLSGVNGRAFSRPSREVPQSIVERNLGRVVYSGVDENGKQYFTGGALVNPLTGQLEGPPIDRTILPRARRAAMITGGQQ